MDEQFKEIEGLLESTDPAPSRSFKKYAKIVLPHVALVFVVCIYAMAGAWIFFELEAPHEVKLKGIGVKHIESLRKDLIQTMWSYKPKVSTEVVDSKDINHFLIQMQQKLETFNMDVFKAFKDQYVRYDNVRVSNNLSNITSSRLRKHRKSNSKSDKSGKLWTASSSLFFAATTMATIGYGNIVPVTPYGRIACVVFALFGAPLAIITIGDLGKFLSECTIWLYKKIKNARKVMGSVYRRWSKKQNGVTAELGDSNSVNSIARSNLDWEDLDKTEVPVLLVFAILLLYIALGGVLFAFLESWTYMDAFYYCFVSLTTIGFGDFVPERHEYIVVMLIYLGVGLAVTTMCIDLVGIQYIQKIHYFGRKFRGTDLLHLLKRKRMIERRLALGQGDEILKIYLSQMSKEPPPHPSRAMAFRGHNLNKKYANTSIGTLDSSVNSLRSPSNINVCQGDIAIISENSCFSMATSCSVPTILSLSSPDSPYTTSSASRRSMMYARFENRDNSWIESGPDLSFHCSLSTSPSVYMRESLYENYKSPQPSILSFHYEYAESPIQSPDLKAIADEVRRMPKSLSCTGIMQHLPSQAPSETSLTTLSSISTTGLHCMSNWEPEIQTARDETVDNIFRSPVPSMEFDDLPEWEIVYAQRLADEWIQVDVRDIGAPSHISFSPVPESIELTPSVCSDDFPNNLRAMIEAITPEQHYMSSCVSVDEESSNFFADDDASSSCSDSPPFDLDLGAFELVNTGMTAESLLSQEEPVIYHKDMPVHSVHHDTVQTEAALENLMNAPKSMLSSVVPPTMVADNYCFIVDGDKVKSGDIMGDDQWWRHTSRPTKYFYSDDMKKFVKVNCITARGGQILSARMASTTPSHSAPNSAGSMMQNSASSILNASSHTSLHSSTTPRTSISMSARGPGSSNGRGEKVELDHVYKVVRYYSFWKTCTSFHRICTMIDKVTDNKRVNPGFKRRLFVQYLWRNAKPNDKARVQKDFDPRRQRLLRFVTTDSVSGRKNTARRGGRPSTHRSEQGSSRS
uniref:TWiK family of potassium channels protein 7 n=1 Tax=Rhabditophanes sp. KR3021 TaxID=114890 RepID=A0AC35U7S5_9BILA